MYLLANKHVCSFLINHARILTICKSRIFTFCNLCASQLIAIPLRRIDPQQVLDKEIPSFYPAIGPPIGMVKTRQGKEFKGLTRFYQRVGDPVSGFGRNVVVPLSYHQQQIAVELGGIGDIRLFIIVFADGVAHPLLVPPLFVDPVIMTSAGGDRGFVEITME